MPLSRIEHPRLGVVWYRFEGPVQSSQPSFVHGMVTRLGGVSQAPFASLNLGGTVGDDAETVDENHRRLFEALEIRPNRVVSPYQVHGAHVAAVGADDGGTTIPATDGLITNQRNVALLLRFADCVPVLFHDPVHHVAGVAHAGWRGVAAGVVPAAITAMSEHFGSRPDDLWAGIGPAIGLDHYEVGPEVVTAIRHSSPDARQVAVRQGGAWHVDLAAAVKLQLLDAGVHHIDHADLCTACHTAEWYSHRAEKGATGRFGVIAMLA
ncbi:MAG: peptidoglycan editing factor PgeF [Anaerolineae bacterium]